MDNLQKLHDAVKTILDTANKPVTNVGALRGVMVSKDTVIVDGKTYHAIQGTQVAIFPGANVWCQLSDNSTAVIIGA